jgi:hypothetical protein
MKNQIKNYKIKNQYKILLTLLLILIYTKLCYSQLHLSSDIKYKQDNKYVVSYGMVKNYSLTISNDHLLIYTPNTIELTQCMVIVIVGVLASKDCMLPIHCGQIQIKLITSGWFSNSYLCLGVGNSIVVIKQGNRIKHVHHDDNWHRVYKVQAKEMYNVTYMLRKHSAGYTVAPADIFLHHIIFDTKTLKFTIPDLTTTSDSRYCIPIYTQYAIESIHDGYYNSIQNALSLTYYPIFKINTTERVNWNIIVKDSYLHDIKVSNGIAQIVFNYKPNYISCNPYTTTYLYLPSAISNIQNFIVRELLNLTAYLYQLILYIIRNLGLFYHYLDNHYSISFSLIIIIILVIRQYSLSVSIILTLLITHIYRILFYY